MRIRRGPRPCYQHVRFWLRMSRITEIGFELDLSYRQHSLAAVY